MKLSRITLLLLSAAILVSGCKREKEDPATVSVSKPSLAFSSTGGTEDVGITASTKWQASTGDNWLTLQPAEDHLTITAAANGGSESRSGKITVTAGSAKAEISVVQSGYSGRPADDPYPQADYSLDQNAIFVKPDYAKAVSSADPGNNTFTVPASAVGNQKPVAGQKIIMNTPTDLYPGGLLAKVVSVSESGGSYQVKYEPIKLEEAFRDLHINEEEIDLAANVLEVRDANGNKVEFSATKAADKKTFTLEIPSASWPLNIAGLELAPIFKLDITMFFQAIVADYKLYSFNFDTQLDLEAGATLSCGLEGKAIDERRTLYFVICGAIPVGPVIVTPMISIDALFETSGKVSVEAKIQY